MRILFDSKQTQFKEPFGTLVPNQECTLTMMVPASVQASHVTCHVLYESKEHFLIPMEKFIYRNIKREIVSPFNKKCGTKYKARCLADNGSKGSTARTHLEVNNENNVENKIHDRGNTNEKERVLGVSHATQYRADDVISIDDNKTNHAYH